MPEDLTPEETVTVEIKHPSLDKTLTISQDTFNTLLNESDTLSNLFFTED